MGANDPPVLHAGRHPASFWRASLCMPRAARPVLPWPSLGPLWARQGRRVVQHRSACRVRPASACGAPFWALNRLCIPRCTVRRLRLITARRRASAARQRSLPARAPPHVLHACARRLRSQSCFARGIVDVGAGADVCRDPPVCRAQVLLYGAQPGGSVRRGRQQQLQVSACPPTPSQNPRACRPCPMPQPHGIVTCLWAVRSYGDGENWDSGEIGENIPAAGDYVIYS